MRSNGLVLVCATLVLALSTCKDGGNPINGNDKPPSDTTKLPCPPIRIGALSPYGSPVWHPTGRFIGFNHTPLERIEYPDGEHCQGRYVWKFDSTGFWLINADGSNMRRVFPYPLAEPAWSADGGWIAFGADAQIYKMRFTGTTFDTTSVVQLTTEGRNFYPAWSPDGEWIAYDRSLADASGPGGIWRMKADGSSKEALFGGAFPVWHPNGRSLLAVIGTNPMSRWTRFVRYYFFQSTAPETLDAAVGSDNRNPRYSPDGTNIAFASMPVGGAYGNIWMMNADGSNPRQVTTEGTSEWFSWSPDGKSIAYVSYRFTDWSYLNGMIWVMDIDTGQKRQLTFNHPPSR